MKLSFTGTRSGLTPQQAQALFNLLLEHQPEEVFHGDCIGADEQFHACCRSLAPVPLITLLPCNLRRQRAFCEGADTVHEPADPLTRNRRIVDAGDLLIVCPAGLEHVVRSGTWATYRYAVSVGKPTIIVWHDGTTSRDEK